MCEVVAHGVVRVMSLVANTRVRVLFSNVRAIVTSVECDCGHDTVLYFVVPDGSRSRARYFFHAGISFSHDERTSRLPVGDFAVAIVVHSAGRVAQPRARA